MIFYLLSALVVIFFVLLFLWIILLMVLSIVALFKGVPTSTRRSHEDTGLTATERQTLWELKRDLEGR